VFALLSSCKTVIPAQLLCSSAASNWSSSTEGLRMYIFRGGGCQRTRPNIRGRSCTCGSTAIAHRVHVIDNVVASSAIRIVVPVPPGLLTHQRRLLEHHRLRILLQHRLRVLLHHRLGHWLLHRLHGRLRLVQLHRTTTLLEKRLRIAIVLINRLQSWFPICGVDASAKHNLRVCYTNSTIGIVGLSFQAQSFLEAGTVGF